ncbi:MAG: hypothetical protein ACPKPY_03255 [Nitrososphaeraceae archaeon]
MSKICFVCRKELGRLTIKWSYNDFLNDQITIPYGMVENDSICNPCMEQIKIYHKEEVKEVKNELKTIDQELLKRTPEYKKRWNKNGIIQFKNERIAILQRAYGSQVEFIIAFDDLTTQGYELKAIDEGKTGGGQGFSGGVNAYFYFQKNESLLFPNGSNTNYK